MIQKLKVVCAWCGKIIRGEGDKITHGICPECSKKQMDEAKQLIKKGKGEQK